MNLLQIHEPGATPNPHAEGAAVGIDLGTTHSVIAVASKGVATVLHDICGGVLVPSVVHYGKTGPVVGKVARGLLQEGEKNVVASIKRLMGRSSKDAKALGFPHNIMEEDNVLRFEVGGRRLTPVEVSADILSHMKTVAESAIGQKVTQAVITVPAYFDDSARQATKDAAKLAGLEVLRLINEPTAAALAYGLDKNARGIFAIYDLGGGTFDISVLKLEEGVFQVLATGGDVTLGGDDFDRLIAEMVCGGVLHDDPAGEVAQSATGGSVPPSNVLLAKARTAKEKLSAKDEVTLEWQGKAHTITRKKFDTLIVPLVEKTLSICNQVLEDAGLMAKEVDGIVLVGGSTRTPYVRAQVEKLFGKKPLSDINPDEVVAVGAAIQAEALTQGSDNLLLDVVPLALGLETMGGLTEKIIHRNTPIPVSAVQEFTTYQDGQNAMVIHVVQGEREMVEDNRSLARFELTGIPNLPAGIARVKITFAVDANGLLSVSAREETTGTEQRITVTPSYGISEKEIEKMLLKSMEHAKEDITKRLLREAEIEARRSIEEVKSALASDGDIADKKERADMEKQIAAVEKAIGGGNRDQIDAACLRLHEISRPFAEKRMDKAIASALKGAKVKELE